MLKPQIFNADADEKYRYEIKDILEMEMKILEALNYYLVVYHPYRSLSPWVFDDDHFVQFFQFLYTGGGNYEKTISLFILFWPESLQF